MVTQNHMIKKQVLDFTLDSKVGSFTFQSQAGEFFKTEIIPIIDHYCTGINNHSGVIRIDKLEIDLGVIHKNTFEAEFKEKMAKLFPEKLAKGLNISSYEYSAHHSILNGLATISEEARDFEVLKFIIQEGRLPWWAKGDERYNVSSLLEWSVISQPLKTKQLIVAIAGNPISMKRLIYHASEPVLEKIIAFFQPQYYKEICSLSHGLILGLTGCPWLISSSPSKLQTSVWAGLLSLAITFEGQDFRRQYFAETVLNYLAEIFNTDYNVLYDDVIKIEGDETTGKSSSLKIAGAKTERGGVTFVPSSSGTNGINAKKKVPTARLNPEEIISIQNRRQEITVNPLLPNHLDIRTRAYFQQFGIFEKRLRELQVALVGEKTATNRSLTDQLDRLIEQLLRVNNLMTNLLEKTGKTSVFSLAPSEMNVEEKEQVETLEESIRKFQLELTVIAQNRFDVNDGIGKNIERIMAAMDELTQIAVPSEEIISVNPIGEATEELYVDNAGIVLLWPYLARFFEILGMIKENQFINEEAAERAALILHYLACGSEVVQEYELILNKILCGMDPGQPVNPYFKITEKEGNACENLLQAMIVNWPAIKNVSKVGLRNIFLKREGMILLRNGHWVLRPAIQAYDILLDQMPWGVGTVRLPWMERLLFVEWRL